MLPSKDMVLLAILFMVACLFMPVTDFFESQMSRHMLLQLPLLIFCGVCFAKTASLQSLLRKLDPLGYSAAILASGWFIFWMLPVNLDAAQEISSYRLLKVLSLPLGLGVSGYWAWRQLSGIGRGVLALEAWAMCMRAGWIFVISKEQICASYLPYEQRQVGYSLLYLGAGVAIITIGVAFFRPSTNYN